MEHERNHGEILADAPASAGITTSFGSGQPMPSFIGMLVAVEVPEA